MKISTKGRYAITAMLQLGLNDSRTPVTLMQISVAQGISLSYLEQLFSKLRQSKLVEGARGPGGGYRLARHPKDISVADILQAVNEEEKTTAHSRLLDKQEGPGGESRRLWHQLSRQVNAYLSGIRLSHLLEDSEKHQLTKAFA
ncbi:MAG: Rrf2 family transcriptional regulator [Gammaproteobacteria bacterium]|nr:MAG: Rrf2 family transcriptional regulator [Gammaproteobacteria bacterium]